jgi:hypothetical protein
VSGAPSCSRLVSAAKLASILASLICLTSIYGASIFPCGWVL